VLLGFAVAGATGLTIVAPLVSLGSFALGAWLGGELGSRIGEHHLRHVASALTLEVVILTVATVLTALLHIHPGHFTGDVIVVVLSLSMGLRNATTRRIGVPDLSTTVVTTVLTGLIAESPLAGGHGRGLHRRLVTISAMFAGALVGALLLKSARHWPLACAAGIGLIGLCAYARFAGPDPE
jgi:uncharacterized membrane protein YoaK (UPF0700 family)